MWIEVLHDYRGDPTNEIIVPKGIYAIDDPALLGLGLYLLDNGHAIIIDPPP